MAKAKKETTVKPTSDSGTLTWSPETSISITGFEFESLIKPLELFETPPSQVSTMRQFEIYSRCLEAARAIITRMKEEGKVNEA